MSKIGNMSFEEWQKKYWEYEFIELNKYLTKYDYNILNMLDISVKNKTYTEFEYENLKLELAKYYKDDNMTVDEMTEEGIIDLTEKGVSKNDYDNLISKFEKIDKIYNI